MPRGEMDGVSCTDGLRGGLLTTDGGSRTEFFLSLLCTGLSGVREGLKSFLSPTEQQSNHPMCS